MGMGMGEVEEQGLTQERAPHSSVEGFERDRSASAYLRELGPLSEQPERAGGEE
jgi:hypothetical protein